MITAVTVRGGEVTVLSGTILVAKPRGVVVRFEIEAPGEAPARSQTVTLLYGGGDRVLRLRTIVSEVIDNTKVLLEPVAPVTEGERREFLRAEAAVQLHAEVVGPDYVLPGEQSAPETGWDDQVVDLSGSGVKFLWDSLCQKGDLLFVQLALPTTAGHVVRAIGEVVRAIRDAESGKLDVAVHFSTVHEDDRDRLINYVFRKYYEQLGTNLGAAIDPEP